MEASPLPTSDHESWAELFSDSLSQQRQRVQEFLAAQQERLRRAETELAEQLQQVGDELAQNRAETRQAKEEVQQRSEQLARDAQNLDRLKQEFEARQAEWDELRQRAARQHEALAEQIQRQQDELDRRHEELAGRQPEIEAAEAQLHHDRRELELARQEHQAELEQVAGLRERLEARQAELDRREAAEYTELREELEAARQREHQQAAELETLGGKCNQLEGELRQRPAEGGADAEELRGIRQERDALAGRLAETEQQLADAQRRLAETPGGGSDGPPADEDLQRRYELALEDIRELKAGNARLQQQLSQASAAAPAAPAAGGGGLDWEAEKQRILASLESDFDEDDEEAEAKRLKIEEVIHTTERTLGEKNREIEELKQLLENQSGNLGSVAVGAAALGELFDQDAIIQEERENLKRLQDQWQEKLRQAEIDISVERAKIARERAQVEEKLRTLGSQQGNPDAPAESNAQPDQPVRGRWLARLGLKDPDEKQ